MLQKWKEQDLAKSLISLEKQQGSVAKQQGGVKRESEMAKTLAGTTEDIQEGPPETWGWMEMRR